MKKLFFLIFLLFNLTEASCQTDRTDNWTKDIDFLLTEIKKQHYIYKNKPLPEALNKQAEIIKKNIVSYSDERMLIELERLMYYLGDGHSYIFPFGFNLTQTYFLPIHFYEFSDGMFVIDADEAHAHLVGMKIRQIGKETPEKLMKDMFTYISQDNTMGAKWMGPFFLRFRGMLESYGLENGAKEINIKFEGKKGKVFEEKVTFIPVPQLRGIPKLVALKNTPLARIPLYLSNIQANYWLKYFPEKKAVYFQFNQVRDAENETISEFSKRLETELINKKPSLLIIDTRHNNGGNGDLTPPLITVLKNYEQNQQGKIVVITGRNTFSAAQIFITKVDKETNAEFAGEPSSSSPNFVGEENMIVLPYSGAMGSISNRYHENNAGDTRKWIEPNLSILLSSKAFFNNMDPILDGVFKKYSNRN